MYDGQLKNKIYNQKAPAWVNFVFRHNILKNSNKCMILIN